MKTLTIVTTNPDKKALAAKAFSGSDISLEFVEMETPEIQSTSCEEIAKVSAIYASAKLGRPTVVTDAGYFIAALGGFPGPFVKYVNEMLTAEDMIRLMDGKSDRSVELVETVAYCEPGKVPAAFSSVIRGEIAPEIRGSGRLFDRMFVPEGSSENAAELGREKMRAIFDTRFTHWRALRKHLENAE